MPDIRKVRLSHHSPGEVERGPGRKPTSDQHLPPKVRSLLCLLRQGLDYVLVHLDGTHRNFNSNMVQENKMKSIYTEQAEIGEAISRVKDNQDKVLDKYDPTNEKLKKLMLELVQLERELEDLDEEFEALRKTL